MCLSLSGLGALYFVASNGTSNDANHGGECTPVTLANRVANGATRYGAHECTCTRSLTWNARLSLRANLPGDTDLLVNRRASEDISNLLRLSAEAETETGQQT
jgi:isocitrate dehydrogenase